MFCEAAVPPTFPYGVPTVELQGYLGYASFYLPDRTNARLDLARGEVTVTFPNGQGVVIGVNQMPSDVRAKFWSLAAHAANNPSQHLLMPLDRLTSQASQIIAMGQPKSEPSSGHRYKTYGEDEESNCKKELSGEPIIDCVEVTTYLLYWSIAGESWVRVGTPSEIPSGAYRCPFETLEACNIHAQNEFNEWEKEKNKACFERFVNASELVVSVSAMGAGCPVAAAGLGLIPTGVGTVPGAAMTTFGVIGCVGGLIGGTWNAVQMISTNNVCASPFPGPR